MINRSHKKLIAQKIASKYAITGDIGQGGMGVVFKAIPLDDPSAEVAIKFIHRKEKINHEDLLRFQQEASLMSQLNHPNIISFLDLGVFDFNQDEETNHGYYIVMEYAPGQSLNEILKRDGRKDLPFFFELALQLSSALDHTHGKNIIHRDIKPQNIIVTKSKIDRKGISVKILDFGVAKLLDSFSQDAHSEDAEKSKELAGTPLYMAPEHSLGYVQQIDHRADLYSLGCVLYEALSGQPPFSGESRLEVEEKHKNMPVMPLRNLRPEIPEVIENIILKLLSKKSADRYQSAFSLHADLANAYQLFKINPRKIPAFKLASNDVFFAVSAKLPFIGRKTQFDEIISTYDQMNTLGGRSHLIALSGEQGIGKTRLLSEFKLYCIQNKIQFVSGYFAEYENSLAFNAIANALNTYLIKLIKTQEVQSEQLKQRIKTIMGESIHLLANVFVGLKPFIDKSDSTEKIPSQERYPEEDFNGFTKSFTDLMRCLPEHDEPLVLMLDNLQWADDQSLELIDHFYSNANTHKFLLVLSMRSGAVIPQKLRSMLQKFSKVKRRYKEIVLEDLSDSDTDKIKEILHPNSSLDLGQQLNIHNPMVLIESTRSILSQKEFVSVDLALYQMKYLNAGDLKILKRAATIGYSFQLEMLITDDSDRTKVKDTLERCLEIAVIHRISDDPLTRHLGKTYSFSHRKIRNSVYSTIEGTELGELHLEVVQFLASNQNVLENNFENAAHGSLKDKFHYAYAYHYNKVLKFKPSSEITDAIYQNAFEKNFIAGKSAQKNQALIAAEKYYQFSISLLNRSSILFKSDKEKSQKALYVYYNLIEVLTSQNKIGLSLKILREAYKYALTHVDTFRIQGMTAKFLFLSGMLTEAKNSIAASVQAQNVFLRHFSDESSLKFFLYLRIAAHILVTKINHIANKQFFRQSTHKEEFLEILNESQTVYSLDSPLTSFHLCLDAIAFSNNGQKHTVSNLKNNIQFASMLSRLGLNKISYNEYAQAARDSAKSHSKEAKAHLLLHRSLTTNYFKSRTEEILSDTQKAKHDLNKTDRISLAYCLSLQSYLKFIQGEFEASLQITRDVGDLIPTRHPIAARMILQKIMIHFLRGEENAIIEHTKLFIKRRAEVAARDEDIFIYSLKLANYLIKGELKQARATLIKIYSTINRDRNLHLKLYPFETEFLVASILSLESIFLEKTAQKLMSSQEHLLFYQSVLNLLSKSNLDFCLNSYIKAKIYQLQRKPRKVKKFFDLALTRSKQSGHVFWQSFISYSFGVDLVGNGEFERKDFFYRSLELAKKYEIKQLMHLAGRKVNVSHEALSKENTGESNLNESWEKICLQPCLNEVLNILKNIGQENESERSDYDAIFQLLLKNPSDFYSCIMNGEVIGSNASEIQIYMKSYLEINTALILPNQHTPWAQEATGLENTGNANKTQIAIREPGPDETITFETTEATQNRTMIGRKMNATQINSLDYGQMPVNADQKHARGQSFGAHALIPIQFGSRRYGVLLVSHIGLLNDPIFNQSFKFKLNSLGSYLGLIQNLSKADIATGSNSSHAVTPSPFNLADNNRLQHEFVGSLRKERESTWYLGLNIGTKSGFERESNKYAVIYCSMKGHAKARKELSTEIWYYMQALQTNYLHQDSVRTANDFKRDIKSFIQSDVQSANRLQMLDDFLLTIVVVDFEQEQLSSCHFGSARPFIPDSNHKIRAEEKSSISLNHGQDLRVWEYESAFSSQDICFISYDTTQLENGYQLLKAQGQGRDFDSIVEEIDHPTLKQYSPRYFLALKTQKSAIPAFKNNLKRVI